MNTLFKTCLISAFICFSACGQIQISHMKQNPSLKSPNTSLGQIPNLVTEPSHPPLIVGGVDYYDWELRNKLRQESKQRKEKAQNQIIAQQPWAENLSNKDSFSINHVWNSTNWFFQDNGIRINSSIYWLADPFTKKSTQTITLSDGSNHWYANALQKLESQKKQTQLSKYERYMDYFYNIYGAADRDSNIHLQRDDNTTWIQWPDEYSLDQFFYVSDIKKVVVSSTVDGLGPVDIIGQLRYRIYNGRYSGRTPLFEGIIENKKTPVDLVQKHSIPNGYYYIELFITKPAPGLDSRLGTNKRLHLVEIESPTQDQCKDKYIIAELQSSRYFSPSNSNDSCGNQIKIKITRPPNIETLLPQHDKTTVAIGKRYPSEPYAFYYSQLEKTGSYTINWDGKDTSGRPLPDGMYVFYIGFENYVQGCGAQDIYVHLVNNGGATPEQCAYSDPPPQPQDLSCENFEYLTE